MTTVKEWILDADILNTLSHTMHKTMASIIMTYIYDTQNTSFNNMTGYTKQYADVNEKHTTLNFRLEM